MTQKAINRRSNRRLAKRLRLQRAELNSGRRVPEAHYVYDPRGSQVPGRRFDFKPEDHVPGRFGGPR